MSELDPRDGRLTVWITATKDNRALTLTELAPFAVLARVAAGGEASVHVRVTHHETVSCISIRGNRVQRNAALVRLGDAFYASDYKWILTPDNFDWLKRQLKAVLAVPRN